MFKQAEEISQEVVDACSNYHAIVYHPNKMIRQTLAKSLTAFGIKGVNIVKLGDTYDELRKEITKGPCQIVCTSLMIDSHHFQPLYLEHLKTSPNRLSSSYLVISDENDLITASLQQELILDGMLAGPFTAQSFQEMVHKVLKGKLKAGPGRIAFESARTAYYNGNIDKAEKLFTESCQIMKSPALSYYFLGEISRHKDNQKAVEYYQDGLDVDDTHFLCHKGMIEVLVDLKQYQKAYDFSSSLLTDSIPSTNLLPLFIKIAIVNEKFEDISAIIEASDQVNIRRHEIQNYLAAGLVLAARHLFKAERPTEAIKALKKALELNSENTEIVKQSALTFSNFGHGKEAFSLIEGPFMKNLTIEDFNELQIRVMNNLGEYQQALQVGQKAIQKKEIGTAGLEALLSTVKGSGLSKERMLPILEELDKLAPKTHKVKKSLNLEEK